VEGLQYLRRGNGQGLTVYALQDLHASLRAA